MWKYQVFDETELGNEAKVRKAVCDFLNKMNLKLPEVCITESRIAGFTSPTANLVVTVYWQERSF